MTDGDERPTVPAAYEHIVGTVVGTSFYETVAEGCRELAVATGARLHLVHVGAATHRAERNMRLHLERRLATLVPGCQPEWLDGIAVDPAPTIDRYLTALPRSIGSVASHGCRGPELLLGSVTEDLLGGGRPLVVFGLAALPARPRRVAVCLDGSVWAERLLPEAARWASALHVPLWLVQGAAPGPGRDGSRARETEHLEELADRWRLTGLDLAWDVVPDRHVGRGLGDWLNEEPTTLAVAATPGRSRLRRVASGGVANQLVRHTLGPMVLQLLH
jgi:K+-sensing histidine kinase KdpD